MSETCRRCPSNPKFTHTVREHEVAVAWVPALYDYVKQDVFADLDRPLSYKNSITRFDLDVQVGRVGRVLDAVEMVLLERGWPTGARAGVAAYVVNASTGVPGSGWTELWTISPFDARSAARAYVRELTLAE